MTIAATVMLGACLTLGNGPAIAIIIDDLGNRHAEDYAAIALPGPVAYAILPFSPLARRLADTVTAAGKEVLLHLPMEAETNNELLGPGALYSTMVKEDFLAALRRALGDVPHLVGVSNHMGSLLTRDRLRMGWLMDELGRRPGIVYVDSRTTAGTVTRQAAGAAHVPYLARDVFLDNRQDPAYIHLQMDRLIARALERGSGMGIAHPHPATLAVLLERLSSLERVELVSLAELRRRRACEQSAQAAVKERPPAKR